MELWIRSQDKENLIIANEYLSIGKTDYKLDYVINTHDRPFYIESSNCILGFYATKERALEVLDEIQNILKPKYILDSSSIEPNGNNWVEDGIIYQKYSANAKIEEISTFLYEMPEE